MLSFHHLSVSYPPLSLSLSHRILLLPRSFQLQTNGDGHVVEGESSQMTLKTGSIKKLRVYMDGDIKEQTQTRAQ